jgi:hypothetical protein
MTVTKPELDTLTEIKNLSNAIEILDRASRAACSEPLPVWLKVKHAKQVLENQVAQIIGDPEKQNVNQE